MDDINPPTYNNIAGIQPPSYNDIAGDVTVSQSNIPIGFISDLDEAGPSLSCVNPSYQPDEVISKPPTAPTPQEHEPHERAALENLASLSSEEIREACLQYAALNCCYGTKFVKDTAITDIKNECAYHYRLESYGEKRETTPKTTPFTGELIDGPENGPPPNPWDIYIPITKMFANDKLSTEVPHTAYVKQCFKCVGNCRVRCSSCNGRGRSSCSMCLGSGRRSNNRCTSCSGSGRRRCFSCSGSGQVKCTTCDGRGNLKHFIKLIITRENHVGDFISDTSNLPKEKILKVTGRNTLNEQQMKVYPINHCLDPAVNRASAELISMHERSYPNELIRMQRHTLRAVPLTKANYLWKERQGEFFVYGAQNKVYFENYPQKCCCCTCC